jgi:phage-related protein
MRAAICISLTGKGPNKIKTEDQEIRRLFDLGSEESVTVESANQIVYDAPALRGISRPMNPPPGRSVIAMEP